MDLRETDPQNPHRHPWELSRRDSLLGLLPDDLRGSGLPCLDVGAGDLFFARAAAARTGGIVCAVDPHAAAESDDGAVRVVRDIETLPGAPTFAAAFFLDVLEHVPDEDALLRPALSRLRPSAVVLVTVPAHPALFSAHDEELGHLRRYRSAALRAVLTRNGLRPALFFSFYGSLLGPRAAAVALERSGLRRPAPGAVARWPFPESDPRTRAIKTALDADFALNRRLAERGLSLPGLSLCALCRHDAA